MAFCAAGYADPTARPTLPPASFLGDPTPAPKAAPPTPAPSRPPTAHPTAAPTDTPTALPSASPTPAPSLSPTPAPTAVPTFNPTPSPTVAPTSCGTGHYLLGIGTHEVVEVGEATRQLVTWACTACPAGKYQPQPRKRQWCPACPEGKHQVSDC